MRKIHPTAQIDPGAELADDVEIGPYCIVSGAVKIGRGTIAMNNVSILGETTIGEENRIFPFSVIGGDPQDLKYKGGKTKLVIGNKNVFREYVTINRGTEVAGGVTKVANNCYIMASCHIAHDCDVGDNVVLANTTLLGGHVTIEQDAIVSGYVGVHHFATVGEKAFIGGVSRIQSDVPPFMLVQGVPARVRCVNTVGLKRKGITPDAVAALKKAYKIVWRSGCSRQEACDMLEQTMGEFREIKHLVESLRASEKGKQGRAKEALRTW
ncbi:MAG: acyl-[acyl-carrier-protein]--UDP-N-acetylglucosamine O-acyltransferase [Planctomycetes bacterium RBG_16_59_8]|nr:MAG: acyl-[acyl-carrier-protein]--UDP-N-acetylglucosamine O-acyltransferase [Planctomycetes bacterium RBG_16_59_8]